VDVAYKHAASEGPLRGALSRGRLPGTHQTERNSASMICVQHSSDLMHCAPYYTSAGEHVEGQPDGSVVSLICPGMHTAPSPLTLSVPASCPAAQAA
jgi:hypothetical protein